MNTLQPITTNRVVIRKLEITDSKAFFQYRKLPEVKEFQSFHPESTMDTDEFIRSIGHVPNIPNTWFQLAICLSENNQLIGDIGIHFLEDEAQVEIGYTISPDFQGHGFAIESLRAVFNYLFRDLKKHRIMASVDPFNIKSIKLLNKLGMRKEAHFIKSIMVNGDWLDDCIYAMLSEEWK